MIRYGEQRLQTECFEQFEWFKFVGQAAGLVCFKVYEQSAIFFSMFWCNWREQGKLIIFNLPFNVRFNKP